MSDERAVEGASPYEADRRFPVGEGLAPPVGAGRLSDERANQGVGPYGITLHCSLFRANQGVGPYRDETSETEYSEFRIPNSA